MLDFVADKLSLAVLILAAGSSSRMGTPKQILKWKESNLLNHSIDEALKLNAKEVVVVLGANAELIIPEINNNKVTIVVNEKWSEGIGTSISKGVRYCQNTSKNFDAILIMLCDQPLINSLHYQKLLHKFIPKKKQIIATDYREKVVGVPAVFDQMYFTLLEKLQGDVGAKKIIEKFSNYVKSVENKAAGFDIDTPEQYKNII